MQNIGSRTCQSLLRGESQITAHFFALGTDARLCQRLANIIINIVVVESRIVLSLGVLTLKVDVNFGKQFLADSHDASLMHFYIIFTR